MKETIYECEECGWKGVMDQLGYVEHVHERVLPGELMAAGECPECGALISIADEDVPDYTIDQCIEIARSRGLLEG